MKYNLLNKLTHFFFFFNLKTNASATISITHFYSLHNEYIDFTVVYVYLLFRVSVIYILFLVDSRKYVLI